MKKTARAPLDRYDTPRAATEALLHHVPEIKGDSLFDPCCGDGRMAERLRSRFAQVMTNDIDTRTPAQQHGDLRHGSIWKPATWIVSNPPFGLVGDALFGALGHAQVGVAMLARLSVLEVCKGRELLAEHPPHKLVVLHRSVLKFRGPGSDSVTCAWLVWSKEALSGPPIVALPNDHPQQTTPYQSPSRVAGVS